MHQHSSSHLLKFQQRQAWVSASLSERQALVNRRRIRNTTVMQPGGSMIGSRLLHHLIDLMTFDCIQLGASLHCYFLAFLLASASIPSLSGLVSQAQGLVKTCGYSIQIFIPLFQVSCLRSHGQVFQCVASFSTFAPFPLLHLPQTSCLPVE